MRYTEDKQEKKIDDLLDLVNFVLALIIVAPYRLVSEISKKIMYLPRKVLESLALVTIIIMTVFILADLVIYIVKGSINLVSGFAPLGAKVLGLLIVAGLSLQFLGKRGAEAGTPTQVEEPPKVEEKPLPKKSNLVKEISVPEPTVLSPLVTATYETSVTTEESSDIELESVSVPDIPLTEKPAISSLRDRLDYELERPNWSSPAGVYDDVDPETTTHASDLEVPTLSDDERSDLVARIRKLREGGLY